MQRENNGGRDENGKFTLGNQHGFQPGKSGNERGRPKSALLSDALRKQLAEVDDGDGKTTAEKVASALIQKAIAGDVMACREIFDRCEGKPSQQINLDAHISDWRTLAEQHGLDNNAILVEASKLLNDSRESSDAGDA